ncbi:CPBP family intramembrane glutamic endopeptidase [Haloplanus sp.]|uniref:CPBP family intramembrane glutamic endopeptidase n=1 Tax=Haloplanus sp. TaxID=1961696 RepID=UPI002620D9E1|nr:CPBP family intramembrane glutamic endopeptidase [Haloplanus sp.]
MRRLVWNDAERRPRAPFRVVLFVVVTALLAGGTSAGASVGLGLRARLAAIAGEAVAAATSAVAGIALVGGTVTVAILIAGRYIDRRRLRDFGLRLDRGWWIDCGFGLALGAALLTVVFAAGVGAGWVRVTGTARPGAGVVVRFLGLVATFVIVGVYEELLLRGYLLTNAAEGLVGWIGDRGAAAGAVTVSSLVFGLAHANNPNATLVSTVAIVLAGGMLAAGYVLTGELAVPIGLHTTWNLFQGGVYGFPVSGLGVDVTLIAVEITGPRRVTGGAFGPEAGLLGVGAMLLGTGAIVAWVRWRTGRVALAPAVVRPDLRDPKNEDGDDVNPDRWEPAP